MRSRFTRDSRRPATVVVQRHARAAVAATWLAVVPAMAGAEPAEPSPEVAAPPVETPLQQPAPSSSPPTPPAPEPTTAPPGESRTVREPATAPPGETPTATEPATAPPAGTAPDRAPAPDVSTASASDAFSEFRRAFDAAQYEAALPYAARVLELAQAQAKTPADEEVQVAVMNLAMTQYLTGDYVAAESSYLRAIELVESSGRPLHARLARAYAGLGSTYHAVERHELAVSNFERAVALTRRHEGLLTENQLHLLEKYIDSLTALGRYQDALKGYRFVLRIATRKHGENSPALAPTLERIGRWYVQVGLYDQARRTFRRAIELVQAAEGERSPQLIGPLTALAWCNRRQLFDPDQQFFEAPDPERATLYHDPATAPGTIAVSPSTLSTEAERALQRAALIAEAREDVSPMQVADVRTQLGDWYQTRSLPARALVEYQKAWSAATRVDRKIDGKSVTDALFGAPVLLQIVRPDEWDRYAARPPEQIETHNVVVEFTVNAEGRVQAPRVLDDSGDTKRAEKTTTALDSARYRPRFENGQPVATSGVTLTQPWIVLAPPPEPAPSREDAASGRVQPT